MVLRACQMRQVAFFSSSSVNFCYVIPYVLNLIGLAGGCSNEGECGQGQSEFDLQLLLVG